MTVTLSLVVTVGIAAFVVLLVCCPCHMLSCSSLRLYPDSCTLGTGDRYSTLRGGVLQETPGKRLLLDASFWRAFQSLKEPGTMSDFVRCDEEARCKSLYA